jgi:hypothetical protein
MKIPGVVWGGVMVALPLLAVWLETYFGAYGWAPALAGLLLIIAKVVEVMRSANAPQPPPGVDASFSPEPERSARQRLLWG